MNMTTEQSGAAFWADLYRSKITPSGGRPSAALMRFAEGRTPGRALDLGCARGNDAIWLARQSWDVVGVDIAEAALEAARASAAAADLSERATFERHDLSETFPEGPFDLVSALFLHSPAALPRHTILRRAAQAVASGGLFLAVAHASVAPWSWSNPDTVFPTPEAELAAISLNEEEWTRLLVGAPERAATGPGGQNAIVTDTVIALERRADVTTVAKGSTQ